MNTLTLTLSGMQNNMNGEMNKKLERILRIMEWQTSKIQLLEREVIALKLASTELDIDEGDEMELDMEEEELDIDEGDEEEVKMVTAKKTKKVKKTKKKTKSKSKTRGDTSSKMTTREEYLYDRLCKWRRKLAVDDNVSVYLIFNNDQLERIAKSAATTIQELLEIRGVGKIKSDKYGEVLLRVLAESNE
jgi:superfamily II DNA helicase RecQ